MDNVYSVKLLPRALHDLDGIYRYIAENLSEPGTADKLIAEFEREILSLSRFPNRCALRQTGLYANAGYRQLFVKNYTVVFRVDEENKTVFVVTVRYSASRF